MYKKPFVWSQCRAICHAGQVHVLKLFLERKKETVTLLPVVLCKFAEPNGAASCAALRRKQRCQALPGIVLHQLVHFPDAVLYVDAFEFESIDEKLPKSFKSGVLCNNGWTDMDRHRRTCQGLRHVQRECNSLTAIAEHISLSIRCKNTRTHDCRLGLRTLSFGAQ